LTGRDDDEQRGGFVRDGAGEDRIESTALVTISLAAGSTVDTTALDERCGAQTLPVKAASNGREGKLRRRRLVRLHCEFPASVRAAR